MGGRGSKYDTARDIIGQYSISKITDSKDKIVKFFSGIDKNGGIRVDEEVGEIKVKKATMDAVTDLAKELAGRIIERDEVAYSDYQSIRQMLTGAYSLSEEDRASIPDFSDYIKSDDNFVKIRKNGMELDSAYQELSFVFPQYFDADRVTDPADQLQDINQVLGELRENSHPLPEEYQEAAAQDMRDTLIRSYISLAEEKEQKKRARKR